MKFLYDDVGSFPLPDYVDLDKFKQFYWTGYKGIVNNADIFENRGIYNFFIHPFLQSLVKIKCRSRDNKLSPTYGHVYPIFKTY